MAEQGLDGDELLHRSIRPDEVVVDSSGWRLLSTAFNAPDKKPSVDRARIRQDPKESLLAANNGIVQLVTEEVRTGENIYLNPAAKPPDEKKAYKVDVFARPIPEGNVDDVPANAAHAQIESTPELTGTHFKKLKDKLCRLAQARPFVIRPEGVDLD
jgi:hypothetical protein